MFLSEANSGGRDTFRPPAQLIALCGYSLLVTMSFSPSKNALVFFAVHMAAACLVSGGALAEDVGRATTQITANYGVYWAGLNFGDVRLVITIQNSEYEMKGDGRFSVMGGLIYEWSGDTTSSGQIGKSGPRPSLYTLSYSGGDKRGDVRISFFGTLFQASRPRQTSDLTPRTFPSQESSFAACSIL